MAEPTNYDDFLTGSETEVEEDDEVESQGEETEEESSSGLMGTGEAGASSPMWGEEAGKSGPMGAGEDSGGFDDETEEEDETNDAKMFQAAENLMKLSGQFRTQASYRKKSEEEKFEKMHPHASFMTINEVSGAGTPNQDSVGRGRRCKSSNVPQPENEMFPASIISSGLESQGEEEDLSGLMGTGEGGVGGPIGAGEGGVGGPMGAGEDSGGSEDETEEEVETDDAKLFQAAENLMKLSGQFRTQASCRKKSEEEKFEKMHPHASFMTINEVSGVGTPNQDPVGRKRMYGRHCKSSYVPQPKKPPANEIFPASTTSSGLESQGEEAEEASQSGLMGTGEGGAGGSIGAGETDTSSSMEAGEASASCLKETGEAEMRAGKAEEANARGSMGAEEDSESSQDESEEEADAADEKKLKAMEDLRKLAGQLRAQTSYLKETEEEIYKLEKMHPLTSFMTIGGGPPNQGSIGQMRKRGRYSRSSCVPQPQKPPTPLTETEMFPASTSSSSYKLASEGTFEEYLKYYVGPNVRENTSSDDSDES